MGNGHNRMVSSSEAKDILSQEKWARLKSQLDKYNEKVSYNIYSLLLTLFDY